ncbi:hypothetical protein [Rhodoflexus sp.]
MKNSIVWPVSLFLLIFLTSQNLLAQNNVAVLRYIASCQKKKTDARYSEWKDIEATIKVVLDFDKMVIRFYNQAETKYDLLSQTNSGKDKDGDAYYDYEAIDEEGIRCEVRITVDRNGNGVYLYSYYDNVSFGYFLRK